MKYFHLILLILLACKKSFCANILAIQATAFYSHQMTHYPILKELVAHGHNLTIFSTHYMDFGGENVTQYVFYESVKISKNHTNILDYKVRRLNPHEYIGLYEIRAYYEISKKQLEHPKIQELVLNPHKHKFDILLIEDFMSSFAILSEIYDCPIIFISSGVPARIFHHVIGNNLNSIIHSEIHISPYQHAEMNLLQRIWSLTGSNGLFLTTLASTVRLSQNLVREKFPDLNFPSLPEILIKRLTFTFCGTSITTFGVHPSVPNYHQIGFVHTEGPKNLRDFKVKEFLDNSPSGVVVVSFGTLTSAFSQELAKKFLDVFEKLPFNVIWKADIENFQTLKNILILKWLQLSDILAHPNVKLLISHGGLKTIEEAIDREVPMILIPMSYDQPFNAEFQAKQKIATLIDLNKFTRDSLKDAIMEMTKPEYKENIKKIRSLAYDQMSTSLDEAVENIEYFIKYRDMFHFQNYEARDTNVYGEIYFDILVIIGRIVSLISIVLRYIFM